MPKSRKKYILLIIVVLLIGIILLAIYDPFNQPYISKLTQIAERGDGEACWCLHLYYIGRDDDKKAEYWLQKAAISGYPRAQYLWAVKLIRNDSPSPEIRKEGFNLLVKSAERNYAFAQAELGFQYLFGNIVHRDENQSEYWYRRAAKNGVEFAMMELARLLSGRKNDSSSLVEAYSWSIIGYNRSDSSTLNDEAKNLPETVMNKAKKLGFAETMIKQTSELQIKKLELEIPGAIEGLNDFAAWQCEIKTK
jgi:TPR repeat protein